MSFSPGFTRFTLYAKVSDKPCAILCIGTEVATFLGLTRTTAKIDTPARNGVQINVLFKRAEVVTSALILDSKFLIIFPAAIYLGCISTASNQKDHTL